MGEASWIWKEHADPHLDLDPYGGQCKFRIQIHVKIIGLSLKLFSKIYDEEFGKLAQEYSAMLVTPNARMKVSKFS